jgi:hypothetical protein
LIGRLKMRPLIHAFGLVLLAASFVSCGASTSPSVSPNLSGTWSGVVGAGSGGGNALRLTWLANQTGDSVSGPATVSTSPAVTNIAFGGTLSGTLAGSQLSLAFTSPPGSVSGFGNCFASGTGSATVNKNTISGNLSMTFTSCEGAGITPPASNQLTLTRP